MRPATAAARAMGKHVEKVHGVVPPIFPSVSYERHSDGTYPGGHSYSRDQNPSFDQVEAVLAELDGGADALVFASGMAAATTIFEVLPAGTHVVAPQHMYWTIRLWMERLCNAGRITLDFIDQTDTDLLKSRLHGNANEIVWLETPSNPLGIITDINACAEIAHAAGATVVADGTLATPVLCKPLELGADIVLHSATKQLNGHTDVLAGALVTAGETDLWQRIRTDRGYRGAVLGPFESWLLLRGMRTLFLRVRASADSALKVAEAMQEEEQVSEVLYPGLPEHPGHGIAASQMNGGFGFVVSIRVRGGARATRRVADSVELFTQATSLGGVESLIEHRAGIEGDTTQVPDDLLRLSIGIEDPRDLIEDLQRALRA